MSSSGKNTRDLARLARHPVWLLLGAALAVRILPVAVRFVIGTDEGLFLTLGQNLAAGVGYTGDGHTLQVDFPPGYAWFAAAIYALGGSPELPARLNVLVIGSLLPLPVYWLARRLADPKTALIAGLFTALLPALVLSQGNFEAAAEPLYSLLLYTGWASLGWGLAAASRPISASPDDQERRQARRTGSEALPFLLAGLSLGAAHLVRWEGVILGLFGAGALALTLRRKMLLPGLLYLAGLALFAIPYALFLDQHTGSFISPKTRITQLHGAALDVEDNADPFAFEKSYVLYEQYLADPRHPPEPMSAPTPLPQRYLNNLLVEVRLFFTSGSLMAILWIMPAALGAWAMDRKRALFLALLFIPLAAIPASVVDPRYFLPPLPAALIFAARGWTWLGERRLSIRSASLVLPGRHVGLPLLAATLAVFVLADLAGPFLYPRPTEYRAAGLALHGQLPAGAHMLARKRQTPFYAGAAWEWLPFEDLAGVLDYAEAHRADYLMLDARTIALRPQLADLLDPANAPPALTLIYRDEGETVVVYKINH